MPSISTTANAVSMSVSLTMEQAKLARKLAKQFHALTAEQQQAFISQLQDESPGMWHQVHEACAALEARHIQRIVSDIKPVQLDDLPAKLGWDPNGWQMTLLRSLDEPGGVTGVFKTPGLVTVSELLTALRNPDNRAELSTASINRLKAAISTIAGGPAAEIAIDNFSSQWKRDLLESADAQGNRNHKISADELTRYLDANPTAVSRITSQNLGVMLHQLAALTGEPDPFKLGGLDGAFCFVRTAYAGAYDAKKNVSRVVCQVITAQDIAERKAFARDDAFRKDDKMALNAQVTPGDFDRTGFDRGHLASNADAADAANAFESFLMSNMAPQYPNLNRGAWRFLEDRLRAVVEATGARAIVYTGTIFLDDDGKQLSDEQLARIGKHGVAVPSHSFKSVLARLSDGTQTTLSFMVKNVKELPIKEQECGALLRSSRVDIATLQQVCGVADFFEGFIAHDVERELKANKTAGLKAPDAPATFAESFEYLFGKIDQPTTWKVPLMGYEVDMYLERAQEVLAAVKLGKLAW